MKAHPKPSRTGLISPLFAGLPAGTSESLQAGAESSDIPCAKCCSHSAHSREQEAQTPSQTCTELLSIPRVSSDPATSFPSRKISGSEPFTPSTTQAQPPGPTMELKTRCCPSPANLMMLWLSMKTLGPAGRKSRKTQLLPGERLAQPKEMQSWLRTRGAAVPDNSQSSPSH